MVTPAEAYNLVSGKVRDFVGETVYDYGDYYVLYNCLPGDSDAESYKVDKETGEISDFDFLEYVEAMKKFRNDEEPKEYSMKKRASS